MVGALDPLGLPLVTDVLSGEKADDPLYIRGRPDCGDAQRAGAVVCRRLQDECFGDAGRIQRLAAISVSAGADWGERGVVARVGASGPQREDALQPVYVENAQGAGVVGEGYEIERQMVAEEWSIGQVARAVLVAHSETYAKKLKRGLNSVWSARRRDCWP